MNHTMKPTPEQVEKALKEAESDNFIWSDVPILSAEVRRLREEVAAVTVELTHKIVICGVAAMHPDADLTKTYPQSWQSAQADQVRELRKDRDSLRARVSKLESDLASDRETNEAEAAIDAEEKQKLRARVSEQDRCVNEGIKRTLELEARNARLVAAGNEFRRMIELSKHAPMETWPTDDEMDAAVTAWDAAIAAQAPDAGKVATHPDTALCRSVASSLAPSLKRATPTKHARTFAT